MSNKDFNFAGTASGSMSAIGSFRVPLLPEKRKNTIQVPGLDGVVDFGNNSYCPLIIPGECAVTASNFANLLTNLSGVARWLSDSGPLILGRDPTKRWPAAKIYNQIDFATLVGLCAIFPITVECNPPFLEDVNATVINSLGAATDYGSPIKFFPVITITMTSVADSVQISLASTGELMKVTDSLVNGNVIVFDMAKGLVTKNGVSCMSKLSANAPFGIPPGTQTISVTTTGTYTATISYRKRYLYA